MTLKRSSGSKKWNVTRRSRVVLRTVRTAPVTGASAGASTTPSGRRRSALLMRSVRSRTIWTVSAAAASSPGSVSVSASSCSSGRSAVTRSPSIEVPTMRARICSGRSRPSPSRRQRPSSTASLASSPGVSVALYSSSPHCTPSDCQYSSTSMSAPSRITPDPSLASDGSGVMRYGALIEVEEYWQSLGVQWGELLYSATLTPGDEAKLVVLDGRWRREGEGRERPLQILARMVGTSMLGDLITALHPELHLDPLTLTEPALEAPAADTMHLIRDRT